MTKDLTQNLKDIFVDFDDQAEFERGVKLLIETILKSARRVEEFEDEDEDI